MNGNEHHHVKDYEQVSETNIACFHSYGHLHFEKEHEIEGDYLGRGIMSSAG
jgi:hypothetical protein